MLLKLMIINSIIVISYIRFLCVENILVTHIDMGSSEIIYFDKYFIISNRINRIFLLYIINVLGFLYNIITQLTIRTNHAYITLTLSSKKNYGKI